MLHAIVEIFYQSFVLLAKMAPYMFLGIVAAGVLHVLLPIDFVSKKLGANTLGSVFKASILGIPIPLCSCGVVPVAASLDKNGASKGATLGFLVTTPTSGVDSILATYSLLGLPITVFRVAISFILGLVTGVISTVSSVDKAPKKHFKQVTSKAQSNKPTHLLKDSAVYAFGELYEGIAKPLLIGIVLGGAISYFVPPQLLTQYVSPGIMSYIIMLALGIPLYVCASGSIPLAAVLLAKGISPGAAIIFLITGPATNAATLSVIYKLLGRKNLIIYLSVLIFGTLGLGYLTDVLFSVYSISLPTQLAAISHEHVHLGILEWVTGILLAMLTGYHILMPQLQKLRQIKGGNMIELTVPDMTCNHCSSTVETTVKSIDGVKNVIANAETKQVNVECDASLKQTVIDAIKNAGYSPK